MRIAWFTPLSASTGIARFSDAVVHTLVEHAEVEVWAEPGDDDMALRWCPVHRIDDPAQAARETEGFDLRVYNIGNNPAHHAAIFATYELARGLTVVHDKVMHNFFYGGDPVRYRRLMRYYYGRAGAVAAERALEDPLLLADGEFLGRFPLVEPVLWNAEGAVAHSAHAAEALERYYGDVLPVEWLHLTLNAHHDLASMKALATREELGLPSDSTVIVAAGRLGRGKRIETVIEAMAGSETLRERGFFAVVGGGEREYAEELVSQVAAAGLTERVRFVSQADDWLLQSYLQAADICVNLRYPSTESSSGSLVEQLYHAKPVVVYDIGIYSEVPDDVVVKVRVAEGAAGVAASLECLLADSQMRERIGQRAESYARENHMPDTYAVRFMALAHRMIERREALDRIDAAGESLGRYRTLRRLRRAAGELGRALAAGPETGRA